MSKKLAFLHNALALSEQLPITSPAWEWWGNVPDHYPARGLFLLAQLERPCTIPELWDLHNASMGTFLSYADVPYVRDKIFCAICTHPDVTAFDLFRLFHLFHNEAHRLRAIGRLRTCSLERRYIENLSVYVHQKPRRAREHECPILGVLREICRVELDQLTISSASSP